MAFDREKRFERFGRRPEKDFEHKSFNKSEEQTIVPKEKPKLVKMPKSLTRPVTSKTKKGKVLQVTSKRKSAVARATVRSGKGRIIINKKPYTAISNRFILDLVREPLVIVEKHNKDLLGKVDINILVNGGGVMGQMQAVRNCIAKAFVQYFDDLELTREFLEYDRSFLVDDVRRVESKKPLGPKARAKKQHSKR